MERPDFFNLIFPLTIGKFPLNECLYVLIAVSWIIGGGFFLICRYPIGFYRRLIICSLAVGLILNFSFQVHHEIRQWQKTVQMYKTYKIPDLKEREDKFCDFAKSHLPLNSECRGFTNSWWYMRYALYPHVILTDRKLPFNCVIVFNKPFPLRYVPHDFTVLNMDSRSLVSYQPSGKNHL